MGKSDNISFDKEIVVNDIDILPYILDITKMCTDKGWNIKPYPKLKIDTTTEYIDDILGRTGHFDANNDDITIITAGRHPIDVCKTYIHELRHYHQKQEGLLKPQMIAKLDDPRYMEKDNSLMELEKDAYLMSGFIFREWRDSFK
jgi:hypothetical protein